MEIAPRALKECRARNARIADVRIAVVMSEAMFKALKAEAERMNTSSAEIVRELIRVYLEGLK